MNDLLSQLARAGYETGAWHALHDYLEERAKLYLLPWLIFRETLEPGPLLIEYITVWQDMERTIPARRDGDPIAIWDNPPFSRLNGIINEIQHWTRRLTPEEVETMRRFAASNWGTITPADLPNLAAWYAPGETS